MKKIKGFVVKYLIKKFHIKEYLHIVISCFFVVVLAISIIITISYNHIKEIKKIKLTIEKLEVGVTVDQRILKMVKKECLK